MKKQGKAEKPVAMLVRFYKSERKTITKWAKRFECSRAEIIRRAVAHYDA